MSWSASLAAWSTIIRPLEINSVSDNKKNNLLLQEWQVNNDGGLLQRWQVDNDKSDNNEDKDFLLLRR